MDKQQTSDEAQTAERRRWRRTAMTPPVMIEATIGETVFEGEVLDLSPAGARIKFEGEPQPSGDITIRHAQLGNIAAQCIWREKATMGLKFREVDLARHVGYAHTCP